METRGLHRRSLAVIVLEGPPRRFAILRGQAGEQRIARARRRAGQAQDDRRAHRSVVAAKV